MIKINNDDDNNKDKLFILLTPSLERVLMC